MKGRIKAAAKGGEVRKDSKGTRDNREEDTGAGTGPVARV